MGIPSRRELLRWFHALEDSAADRPEGLRDGWGLIQAAQADGVIGVQDEDGFADLVLKMAREDLIDFDYVGRGTAQFGRNASHDLQQVTNLRSTPKGRGWMGETPSAGASITFGEADLSGFYGDYPLRCGPGPSPALLENSCGLDGSVGSPPA